MDVGGLVTMCQISTYIRPKTLGVCSRRLLFPKRSDRRISSQKTLRDTLYLNGLDSRPIRYPQNLNLL